MNKKTALISIIGRPNAGKSTLLNEIMGQKISIVTPKVQTTRTSIKGIYTEGDTQLVFIDTPGIFSPSKKLEKAMLRCAWSSISGADIICIVIDITQKRFLDDEFRKIIKHISTLKAKKVILFNKIDVMERSQCGLVEGEPSEKISEILDLLPSAEPIFISALKNRNTDKMLKFLCDNAHMGEWLYPEDEITTAPLKFLCSEITREKLFLNLSEEIPYNLTVECEQWEQISENEAKIFQAIIVNKDSYKMIVLGKSGQKIKKIGIESRKEIEKSFGIKAHLFLFVKVRENWDSKLEHYAHLGLILPK